MKPKHIAVSLITNDYREAGKLYDIVTDLRSKRIKYVDKNGEIKSTDNKKSFKILSKKYL